MDKICNKTIFRFILPFCLSISSIVSAQYMNFIYKTIDTVELGLNIYYPNGEIPSSPTPAIVFFFGGGWVQGGPDHFAGQCEYLASLGIIAIAVDYRTYSKYGTSPLECISDAKSSIRWIRANSSRLRIDPGMLVAAGGSAGGHLALCCALIEGFSDRQDDLSISTIPNALVLFNPVVNTTKSGYGYERFGEYATEASPLMHLKPGLPAALIFHGTEDQLVRIEEIRAFSEIAEINGDNCSLIEYPGRGHGFFNRRGDDEEDYWKTLMETENFLRDRKFLPPLVPKSSID